MATLKCVVVTPEKAVLDEPAAFVVVPMFDGELGVDRLTRVGRQECGSNRIHIGQLDRHHSTEERIGDLHQDASAVAAVRLSPRGATVLQVAQCLQALLDQVVAGPPCDVDDERDATGVVLLVRVVQALSNGM